MQDERREKCQVGGGGVLGCVLGWCIALGLLVVGHLAMFHLVIWGHSTGIASIPGWA